MLTQVGPLTYDDSDPSNINGFEHDLAELFAQELGVEVKFVVAAQEDFPALLRSNKAHLAAAWLTPDAELAKHSSPAFLSSRDVLVQHEASLPIDELEDLEGRTVHVLAGSRQAASMHVLQAKIDNLEVVKLNKSTAFDLLQAVASGKFELAVVDNAIYDVALQVAPALQASLFIGEAQPITWHYPENANPELVARASEFLQRIQSDPAFIRLKERYFGHIHRLENADISKLIELSKTTLPKLRPLFHAAQARTGIDWRLLAALAYQESQWNPNATSPTGVRGIMMLTEDTADYLGVSNRLDPQESILAGARYLEKLRSQLPASTPEPDRTWLALAAYNVGPGHFNAALTIGRQLKADTTAWHAMKAVLPLLAKPQYYQRLKSGRGRGGEAVTLVENVRSFYDILSRNEAHFRNLDRSPNLDHSPSLDRSPSGSAIGLKTDGVQGINQEALIFSSPPM